MVRMDAESLGVVKEVKGSLWHRSAPAKVGRQSFLRPTMRSSLLRLIQGKDRPVEP